MAVRTWKLIDRHSNLLRRAEQFSVQASDVGLGEGRFYALGHALQSGSSAGVDMLEISNGAITVELLPTRGMGIRRAWSSTPSGVAIFGWESPVRGPVHPALVDLGEPSGLGWLDGFDELLVRCGLESNGAPEFDETTGRLKYPLHGRIANKPAHELTLTIDTDKEEITLVGVVEEARFHFLKLRLTTTMTLKLGSHQIAIRDEIENLSSAPAEAQMLYHVNFGLPLLDAGSQVMAPVKTLVPRNPHAASGLKSWNSYLAPQTGYEEMVYFLEMHGTEHSVTEVLLKNAHSTRGASLIYKTSELPCFSLWKDTGSAVDGYVTGLEPGTNYPNPRSFEGKHNRVMKLAPLEKKSLHLTLELHTTEKSIAAAEARIAKLQAGKETKIHDAPLADWCA
ncbi:conserved hypothetical protein [Pirellula staleyi DSM 6068]|uniref:DUF4432 domain-containing protein n=1 Tax=Pirellula staleyi (strain ATCC 27377 / DSM 6068 / ICPB 4128) TaxID=530564 RepID=D2R5D2_PIRSD|nr:aldose 1-epimerase family protein [Pirellula staleyi]ADB15391.1 conserved hypothetical protein [Pirellula staleyi DSM 6068]